MAAGEGNMTTPGVAFVGCSCHKKEVESWCEHQSYRGRTQAHFCMSPRGKKYSNCWFGQNRSNYCFGVNNHLRLWVENTCESLTVSPLACISLVEYKVNSVEDDVADGAQVGSDEEELDGRPTGIIGWIREVVRAWGPAIVAVLVIRTFLFEPFRIPSGSMVPSLLIGDHVLVTKFSYGIYMPFMHKEILDLADPEHGDIIVFRYPRNPKLNYIKRVVALPGDRIRVQNNKIILNGEPQPFTYTDKYQFIDDRCRSRTMRSYTENIGGMEHVALTNTGMGGLLANRSEVTVPAEHVFVMGDNRDNSEDSRQWGFVRYDQIKGKAHFVWLSWNGCNGSVGKIRSERFFHPLYE